MSGLPRLSGKEMQRLLEGRGFVEARRAGGGGAQKGSHLKLKHPEQGNIVILPMHRELAPGTLRDILKQAGIARGEFEAMLGRGRGLT